MDDFKRELNAMEHVIDFYNDLRGLGQPSGKLDAWMQAAGHDRPVYVLISGTSDNARENIKLIEKKMIDWTLETLNWQIHKLQPLEYDSPEDKSHKAMVVSSMVHEVEVARKEAVSAADSGSNWNTIGGNTSGKTVVQFKPGTAYKQLVQIAATGQWKNQ